MGKAYLFLLFFCFVQVCCKQKNKNAVEQKQPAGEKNTFFPVTQIILGELAEIDSLPVTPLKIININGKEDSIWLKKKDIRSFAETFLNPEIDSANLKKMYAETSFLDQTINAFTFSYDLIPGLQDTAELKSLNIYVDPETNKILRIYMVKQFTGKAGNQTVQLTWKFGKWCKIATIIEAMGKSPQIKEEKMIWNFNE